MKLRDLITAQGYTGGIYMDTVNLREFLEDYENEDWYAMCKPCIDRLYEDAVWLDEFFYKLES